MAYFRCGGGGMPAGLQSGMDSVLNKKFGTSTTYPASGWPDTVNLMGVLPEKTVSGAIADFSDGSDDVPTKSLVVTIPASLSGVSSVTETQTGRNFIPLLTWFTAGYEYTNQGVTFKVVADGGIKITGKSTSSTYSQFNLTTYSIIPQTEQQLYVPVGTYTFSMSGIVDGLRFVTSGSGNNGFPYSEVTYTNQARSGAVTDGTKPFNYLLLRVFPTDNNLDVTVYPQLEIGSTAHAYEPYTAPTTYTASLGRTIYGGQVDIVNGEGTGGYGKLVLSSDNMSIISRVNANKYRVFNADFGAKVTGSDYATDIVVSGGSLRPQTGSSNDDRCYINASGDFRMNFTNEYASVADMIADVETITLIYPLATPTDFTFDGQEIPTRLGYNAFWSDEGDTEVTYRRDIDLALGGN